MHLGDDALGPGIASERVSAVGTDDEPDLRRDDGFLAAALERPAHQFLVHERPVHVGGVDHGDAELLRPADHAHGVVVARLVDVAEAHRHAAEPDP